MDTGNWGVHTVSSYCEHTYLWTLVLLVIKYTGLNVTNV